MSREEIDLAGLGAYLSRHVDGFEGFEGISRVGAGQSNPTYLVQARSGRYILRAKPTGQLLESAHRVDREFQVIQALGKTQLAVPRALHLSPEDSPMGRMFFVMSFVEGRTFWDPALPELATSGERAAAYDSMNLTLARLHDVDPAAVGLAEFGRPENYFERQLRRWTAQYRLSETGTVEPMNDLVAWLQANPMPDDGRVSIVHGDYRIDNLIYAPDRPEVVAVLDWELSTFGHPFSDLAYQCMHWRLPHKSLFRGLGGVDRPSLGIPSEEAYVQRYCERRAIEGVENWRFLIAFSYFRLAAICQGVYHRALQGNASNPERAAQYGNTTRDLSTWAMQSLE